MREDVKVWKSLPHSLRTIPVCKYSLKLCQLQCSQCGRYGNKETTTRKTKEKICAKLADFGFPSFWMKLSTSGRRIWSHLSLVKEAMFAIEVWRYWRENLDPDERKDNNLKRSIREAARQRDVIQSRRTVQRCLDERSYNKSQNKKVFREQS